MSRLTDVNDTDIRDAIALGCRMMQSVFNPDDGNIPYFRVIVRWSGKSPGVYLGQSLEEHVPGRHLNALLNAEEAADVEIDEEAVENHANAAYFSYSGPVALPLGRKSPEERGSRAAGLCEFHPHHVREGFHALTALVRHRFSDRARSIAEKSIREIFDLWRPDRGWDTDRLRDRCGLTMMGGSGTFITGLARAIGPLVKYYRATAYGPALDLAVMLKEKAVAEFFQEDGGYDGERFGHHAHSTTCVMSSLAQLADLIGDMALLGRVKAFYDNGLWKLRDELGWSVESTAPPVPRPDEGEINNTGDILETALILGRWGYDGYYHDAERILRGHLLPSQLRDVSFIKPPPNPKNEDTLRDVADRVRGGFGFPAPYGHEPIENPKIRFNTDIVGGGVGSLCEAYRDIVRSDEAGHWVNLLFDHETEGVRVESPYTHGSLSITVKTPAPLLVRIPPWADRDKIRVSPIVKQFRFTGDRLLIANPPLRRPIEITFPLAEEEIALHHLTRDIRVRLHGDRVSAMENFGADLTFFDPL
jgi:hypothetical protein